MLRVRIITHRHPEFLKSAYRHDIDLIDHEKHIPAGTKFGSWVPDQFINWKWRVWRMTRERVPIPLGAFESISELIYAIRK